MQIDSLRVLLGIRRMDRVANAQIREMYGVTKRVNERIDESVLRWFGHSETIGDDRIIKRVYVVGCMDIRLAGRPG